MKSKALRRVSLFVVLFILYPVLLFAVPKLLSYKGVLTDKAGAPISGTISMTFRIYNVDTGGTSLWSVTKNVQVNAGMFDVLLGEVTPLSSSLFQNDNLYIGVQVGVDGEMTPRKTVSSEAYVFNAQQF